MNENKFFTAPVEMDEFGQRPSPPAGSQITKVVIKNEDHKGYFDKIKDRFAWFGLHDLNFLGRMPLQPMSFPYLYKGRTGWIQSVSYKAVDNSPEAMDIEGDGELPLRNFLLTPYAQALYLETAYADKGIVLFEHLKGGDPVLVAHLEQIILPDVPGDLLTLGRYLAEESELNIRNADLTPEDKAKADEMLFLMREGVNKSIAYCRSLIAESEGEILTRRNKGVGKASFDLPDRYAFKMLRKDVPTENTIENSPERKTTELLERLVSAIEGSKSEGRPVQTIEEKTEEVERLRADLAAVQTQLADVLFAFKELKGSVSIQTGPTLDDETEVDPKVAAEDLKARLSQTKSNPRKSK